MGSSVPSRSCHHEHREELGRLGRRSLYWQERRGTLVLDPKHHQIGRLGAAGVAVDEMNVAGAFIEGLSWGERYLFSALYLHYDGPLQDVKNRMCIVPVGGVRPAGCMLYFDHQKFLAGALWKILRH